MRALSLEIYNGFPPPKRHHWRVQAKACFLEVAEFPVIAADLQGGAGSDRKEAITFPSPRVLPGMP